MKKFALLTACGMAIAASPAMAQESEPKFGSLRIEAVGGYDIVKLTIDEEVAGEELSDDEGGIAYGVAVGYDHFFLGGFIGAEVELAESTTGVSERYTGDVDGVPVDGTISLDANRDLFVGLRLGADMGDNALFYIKGGYTNAKATLALSGTIDGENVSESESATLDGGRIGVGSEFKIAGSAYVKAEYRYSWYGDGEATSEGETYDIGEAFDYGDLDRHQLMLGVGFRF